MTSKFDSGDPEWDRENCDKWVSHHMREVGRGADLTVTPRGVVSSVARPADGSRPLCMFFFVKDAEEASRHLCDELQRFFPGLPEAPVEAASTWTVKVKSWVSPGGPELGPFGMKLTVLGKPVDLLTANVSEPGKGEPATAAAARGTLKFTTATGMLAKSSLAISAVRTVANTSDGPILNRLAFDFEAEIRHVQAK